MCTVTYISTKHGCLFTSSRDENRLRPKAIEPVLYDCGGMKIVYPKDTKANGTWIAIAENGNAAVLLNGAFQKHISNPPYRKSRGLIFLDIITQEKPEYYFLMIDLDNIEPFTLIIYTNGFLFEARWDGSKKHFIQLDESDRYIWSSATLYSTETVEKRKRWFEAWSEQEKEPTASGIFNFHRFAGDGESSNDILMNRNNEMLTVSITGIDICLDAATMHHFDLVDNKHYLQSIQLETIFV